MRNRRLHRRASRAFTLIEIMIVIAIGAVMMATAIPFVGGVLNKKPMVDGTNELLDVFAQARARAILKGQTAVVRIIPAERTFTAALVSRGSEAGRDDYSFGVERLDAARNTASIKSVTLDADIVIETLGINYIDRKDDDVAEVFFHPNGTCDEFTIVFQMHGDDWRMIHLDVLTGIAEFETDPQRFVK